jgi:hypothetical protein
VIILAGREEKKEYVVFLVEKPEGYTPELDVDGIGTLHQTFG